MIVEEVHILSLFIWMMGQAHDPPLRYRLTPRIFSNCILSASLLVLTFHQNNPTAFSKLLLLLNSLHFFNFHPNPQYHNPPKFLDAFAIHKKKVVNRMCYYIDFFFNKSMCSSTQGIYEPCLRILSGDQKSWNVFLKGYIIKYKKLD